MRWIVQVFILIGIGLVFAGSASAQKRIVLSFDDAPLSDGQLYSGPERTRLLIEALARAEAGPVVMFATTSGLTRDKGYERLEAYNDAGHLIANHSHTHRWASETDTGEYLADIDVATENLASFSNWRAWYRFPYLDEGRTPDRIATYAAGLEARGLINGYVTVDTYDWHLENRFQQALEDGRSIDYEALQELYVDMSVSAAEFYDTLARRKLGFSPVHVLLLHENDLAARFVGDLVQGLRDAGWEIVHPDEAYSEPLATPLTPMTGQGRVAALAIDRGEDPASIRHWGIDENAIDNRLMQSGAIRD